MSNVLRTKEPHSFEETSKSKIQIDTMEEEYDSIEKLNMGSN